MARRGRNPLRPLLGLVALGGLGVAGWAAFTAYGDSAELDEVILFVERAASDDTPDTLPPDETIREVVMPAAVVIDELGLREDVRSVGVEADGGLEIPDETEVGWYEYGSAPGLPGATVLAAHVSWNGALGPFHDLGSLVPGDHVEVVLADGSIRRYEIVERTMYKKDALPVDRIWTTEGQETLVLITCGGDFNPEIRRYRHNIVVYALPVEHERLTESAGALEPAG